MSWLSTRRELKKLEREKQKLADEMAEAELSDNLRERLKEVMNSVRNSGFNLVNYGSSLPKKRQAFFYALTPTGQLVEVTVNADGGCVIGVVK